MPNKKIKPIEKRLEEVRKKSRIGLWKWDIEKQDSWWSEEVYQIYGLPPKEGPPPVEKQIDFYLGESLRKISEAFQACLTQGTPYDLELNLVDARGEKKCVRATATLEDAEGKQMVVGSIQDITDQNELVEELVQNSHFLRSIIDYIPNMIFVKEAKELRFVSFNKAGEALLGVDGGDLMGKNDYDLFPKDQADAFVEKDREVLDRPGVYDIAQEPIDTAEGRRILHTRKVAIRDGDGRPLYLLGISEDITEAVEAKKTIEDQHKALLQTSRLSALGEMAGGIAHEINNPLTIISGTAQQLQNILERPNPDYGRVAAMLGKVVATVDRIAVIIRGLKDFSRDGTSDPYKELSVEQLVRSSLALCQEKLRQDGIQVIQEIDPTLRLEGQIVRLSQILLNLIGNARDAVDGLKEPKITITAGAEGEHLWICVEDNGPGVPERVREQIMQPFFTTKEIGKGTGIGLSLSKGIAEDHGGTLSLLDTGEGACFELRLPIRQRKPNSAA